MEGPSIETMLGKYGKDASAIDYGKMVREKGNLLELPTQEDSLNVIEEKMRALAEVVLDGASVAVNTGFAGTPGQVGDATAVAKGRMIGAERRMFDDWERGVKLPAFNRHADSKPFKGGESARRAYEKRAVGLDRLYRVKGSTIDNVAWWMEQYEVLAPILVGMTKVVSAEIEFFGGQKALSAMEMAEVQTIGKAVGEAYHKISVIQQEVHRLQKSIDSSKNVLQAREHAIKGENPDYRPRESVENRQR